MNLPDAWLHPVAFTIAMAVVVYLHVVLGEMVPKNLALAGPERAAMVLGPPMVAIVTRAQADRLRAWTRWPTWSCGCCGSSRATR